MISRKIENYVEDFIEDVTESVSNGSYFMAQSFVKLLKKILLETPWTTGSEAKRNVAASTERLNAIFRNEPSFENISAKFLKVFEEECKKSSENSDGSSPALKEIAKEVVNELATEVEGCRENIATQARNYVQPNDIIITVGGSRTVEMFLKSARKSRNFKVWIIGNQKFNGREMAERLKTSGIEAEVRNETFLMTLMSSATKVIVGAHASKVDSGFTCPSGTYNVAMVAKNFNRPVIACVPSFKFTTREECCSEMTSANVFLGINDIIPFEERHGFAEVRVQNPLFDFVPATFVGTTVSNV